MTIRVSPERSTLSLPSSRIRSEDARGPQSAAKVGSAGPPPATAAAGKAPGVGQLRAATAFLDRASSIADVGLAAADKVSGLLEQLRELVGRQDGEAANAEFRNLGELVSQTVKNAIFDGANLLDGSQGAALRVPVGADDSAELTLSAFDLTPGGPEIAVTADTDRSSALEAIESALAKVQTARERLTDDAKRVDAHRSFVSLLAEASEGSEKSVPLDVEGARLAALQLRQSLGGEAFSIANQAPQTVLALFR